MSKSANKSSRINTLSEQVERLAAIEKSGTPRDVEQLRHVTLKIYQLLQNQERGRKDATKLFLEKVLLFLGLLENCGDLQLTLNILSCLLELSSGGKKTISSLASYGAIDVLLRVLKSAPSDPSSQEEILVLTHSILAKIGHKDRKFALKTRLTGSLQVTLDVIRQNCSNFKVLHPALLVLKLSAGSSVNCSVLNKAVFISVLFKILPNCGHKRNTTLKLVLDLVSTLLKSKSAAVKAVNLNAVEIFLRMFYDWHRNDHHNRQTAVRKALLNSLKALVLTKVGKAAFVQADGFKTLYYFGTDTLECKELDSLNNIVVQILRLCMPNTGLPVSNTKVLFQLPNIGTVQVGVERNEDDEEKDSDEDESSPLDSEDEEDGQVTESQDDSETTSEQKTCPPSIENESEGRTEEELGTMYHQFFPEFTLFKENEVEELKSDVDCSRCTKQTPIVIPTGDMLSPSSSGNDISCNDSHNSKSNDVTTRYERSCDEVLVSEGTKPVEESKIVTATAVVDEKFKVRSLSQFVGVPSPDIYGHYPPLHPEQLKQKKTGIQRLMLLKNVERVIQAQKLIKKVVYDLDQERMSEDDGGCVGSQITATEGLASDVGQSSTSCTEREAQPQADIKQSLVFESRFECGNLRKAIQIYETEYDLILSSDINCTGHHQWFYFEVSNMEENVAYRFNFINCEKVNSQFNFGMQPVIYSCKDAENGDPGWVRTGSNICYYKNHYKRPTSTKNEKEKYYYSLTFTVHFPYSNDRCYLAYHYPYSFSLLENHLLSYEHRMNPSKIFYKRQILCGTLTGNPCYVITITSPSTRNNNRPYIFLCSRVHPGESNASWVMKGVLDFLLSNKITAKLLREMFIFKIIPMLNPDGVINGCHRCSLSGSDLNRQWINPDPILFPTIYHTKGLLLYLQTLDKKPMVFCDFHGHSRKKNVFLYGCHNPSDDIPVTIAGASESESDSSYASEAIKTTSYRTLPRILHSIAPAFALQNCNYNVDPSKESTARVVVWREFGIMCSYTMESTYCGADQGPYKGCHIGTKELEEMGRCFCAGLLKLGDNDSLTRLLGTISKSTLGEQSVDDEFLFSNGDLFAPVDTFPYEGQDYATQLLV